MNNIKYALFISFSNLKLCLIFLMQLVIITILLYSLLTICFENNYIKKQFNNFNFNDSFSLRMNSDYFDENQQVKIDNEEIIGKMNEYLVTSSFPTYFNYNNEEYTGFLIHNENLYNHEYIQKSTYKDGSVNVILGYGFKDIFNVGDEVTFDFSYIGNSEQMQNLILDVNIEGILDENQYIFNSSNGIQNVDDKILVDYEEIYPYIDENLQSLYLQDILRTSIIQKKDDMSTIFFEKETIKYFEENDLRYTVKPLLEDKENVYLILKSRYDNMWFLAIMTVIILMIIIINYFKALFQSRKTFYSVLVLYGKSINTIVIQLLIELLFLIILNFLISFFLFKNMESFRLELLIIIIFIEFSIFALGIISIKNIDNKIIKLIKED